MNELLSVDEAREHIVSNVVRLGVERIPLACARGRRLATMICSPTDFPPTDISAMDGFAIAARDDRSEFDVLGESAAGHPFTGDVPSGAAVRIFTGAHVPGGTDAVVMQEDAKFVDGRVSFSAAPKPGQHVRKRGTYLRKYSVVYDVGDPLTSSDVGVLASFNHSYVDVFQRPRVAILSTGDELADLGEPLKTYQIVNSNAHLVAALVEESGGIPTIWPVVRDHFGDTKRAFERAVQLADVVLSIGGVSVGDHDHAGRAIRDISPDAGFWKVRMKPGKPLACGRVENTLLIGLPGNPLSAFVCFHQFVRPALVAAMGGTHVRQWLEVPTRHAIVAAYQRTLFVPGRLNTTKERTEFVGPTKVDSGNPNQLVQITALACLPEGSPNLNAGDPVTIQLI